MKVGDRIRVFEIQDMNGYSLDEKSKFKQRPEINKYGRLVELLTKDLMHNTNCVYGPKEVKHVCTMVIKSIKNEKH